MDSISILFIELIDDFCDNIFPYSSCSDLWFQSCLLYLSGFFSRIDAIYAGDVIGSAVFFGDMDSISILFVERIDDFFADICESDFISIVMQYFSNEPSANVSCAKMDCVHNYISSFSKSEMISSAEDALMTFSALSSSENSTAIF